MPESQIRTYAVRARSTDTFGRVLCSARDQHLVVDGPVQNGCPGEAIGPAELFLGGVATCGNGVIEAGQLCDGAMLGGSPCFASAIARVPAPTSSPTQTRSST